MRPFILLFSALVLLMSRGVLAQESSLGTLTTGQALINNIDASQPTLTYNLVLETPAQVTLQAFGQTAQPALFILSGEAALASETNPSGQFTITLTATLGAGVYTVNVQAVNNTSGVVGVILTEVNSITVVSLPIGQSVDGSVSMAQPIAVFVASAIDDLGTLIIASASPTGGPSVVLIDEGNGEEAGRISSSLVGGRFLIPSRGRTYRIEVTSTEAVSFNICWVAASVGSCDGSAISTPSSSSDTACTLTPSSTNVNIRSSASTSAPVVGGLVFGTSAEVLGIAPDGSFYNIRIGALTGWVSAAVVTLQGTCNPAVITPPPFVAVSTATPTQPPPQPTSPPPPQPTVPTGPCLLTINSPVFVYTQPIADVSYLQDQVQMGELIPIGRLADNSWWKTNYASAWVQTSLFGSTLTVSGNCTNLPIVSP
ncbi:SH3 domain-containing protein [Aggregatilineales bacterium SYSU G02658]